MAKKRKRPDLISASSVLQSLLEKDKSSPLARQFLRWRLWKNWSSVVGPAIAKVTTPVGLDGRVVYIWVKSSSWLQELNFMKDPIIQKINAFAGSKFIRDIRFTLDRKSVPNLEEIDEDSSDFLSR